MEEQNAGPLQSDQQDPLKQPYQAPVVSPGTVNLLDRTRPWVMFLSIMGFVAAGFMLLGGLGVGIAGLATQKPEFAVIAILYPLFGLAYIFPSLYLYRYAKRSQALLANPNFQQLESALDAQRSFWKFAGIMTIIGIASTILIFMFAIVAGVLAGVRQQRL